MTGEQVISPLVTARSAEPECPTCAAVGPADDLGLCPSCGADLSTLFQEGQSRFEDTLVLPVPGLAGALRVVPSTFLSVPKLLHHGKPVSRERGVYRVRTESRGTLEVRLKPRFVDPYPVVRVNGSVLRYSESLPWYGTALCLAPLTLIFTGSCVGAIVGALASGVCFKSLRSRGSAMERYRVPLGINAMALVLAIVIVVMNVVSHARRNAESAGRPESASSANDAR